MNVELHDWTIIFQIFPLLLLLLSDTPMLLLVLLLNVFLLSIFFSSLGLITFYRLSVYIEGKMLGFMDRLDQNLTVN